jgi:hypothetical protein
MSEPQAVDTLARMFWGRVERSGDRPAQMMKRGGRWETFDWSRVGTQVRELALGLLALASGRVSRWPSCPGVAPSGCRRTPDELKRLEKVVADHVRRDAHSGRTGLRPDGSGVVRGRGILGRRDRHGAGRAPSGPTGAV